MLVESVFMSAFFIARVLSQQHEHGSITTRNGQVWRKLSPNERFTHCCRNHPNEPKISESCLARDYCRYDAKKETLMSAWLGGKCKLEELIKVLHCSSRYIDHVDCCKARDIPLKCLNYCRPALPHIYPIVWFLECQEHMEVIRQCFHEYEQEHPAYVKIKEAKPKDRLKTARRT